MVEEVRNAILDPAEEEDEGADNGKHMEDRGEPGLDAKTIMWLNGLSGPLVPKKNYTTASATGNVVINSNKHKRRSKFDRLLTSIYPLSMVRMYLKTECLKKYFHGKIIKLFSTKVLICGHIL